MDITTEEAQELLKNKKLLSRILCKTCKSRPVATLTGSLCAECFQKSRVKAATVFVLRQRCLP